jgi:hypothetical protein
MPPAKRRQEDAMTRVIDAGPRPPVACEALPPETSGSFTAGRGARAVGLVLRHQHTCALAVTAVVTWLVLSW